MFIALRWHGNLDPEGGGVYFILTYDRLRGRQTRFDVVSINIRPPSGSIDLLLHDVSIVQIGLGNVVLCFL